MGQTQKRLFKKATVIQSLESPAQSPGILSEQTNCKLSPLAGHCQKQHEASYVSEYVGNAEFETEQIKT